MPTPKVNDAIPWLAAAGTAVVVLVTTFFVPTSYWPIPVIAAIVFAVAAWRGSSAVQQLARVRAQLDRMIDTTEQGLFLAQAFDDSSDFLIIECNPAAAQFLGREKNDIIGRRLTEMPTGFRAEEAFAQYRATMQSGITRSFEIHQKDKSQDRWFRAQVSSLQDNLIVSLSEITERKKAEHDLRQSESLLQMAGRMSRIGAWSVDLEERTIYWSEEVFRIHEVPPDFHPNFDQAVAFYPESAQSSLRAAFQHCVETGETYDLELPFITAKGNKLWVRTIGQLEQEDGVPRRIFGTFQDNTSLKQAALALYESRQFLELALSGAQMSISDRHIPSGRALFDENWMLLLGYSPDEVEQTQAFWDSLIPPEDQLAIVTARGLHFSGQSPLFEVEYRMRAKDGSCHWVLERGKVIERDAHGNPVRLSGVLLDITVRRHMEDQLREAKRRLEKALETEKELTRQAQIAEHAKSEFLAVMSHEIRTPLNGVLGFADLLARTTLDRTQHEYIHTIKRSGSVLLRIIDDILDYSRLEAGRMQMQEDPFSLRGLLSNIEDLMTPAAHHKGLILETKISPALPDRLVGASDRLQQVLLNLTNNAIKFTQNGSVVLGCRPAAVPDHYEFFVRDTGIGIASAKLKSIFEPFVQADASLTRRYGGTGLGLAISRRFVELMGGTINVESSLGAGSQFHFTIPLPTAEPGVLVPETELTDTPAADFAERHPLTILIAEDDPINRKLVVKVLRSFGYATLVAHDGQSAISIFETHDPDCILMDLHMPELDGIEATRRIRAKETNGRRVFIAALTADVMPEERRRCMDAGMDDYLTKPLKQDALAQVLARASTTR